MQSNKIFSNREIESFLSKDDYGSALQVLFSQQLESWTQMKSAYEGLKENRTKSFRVNKALVKVQYNAGRYNSTSAKTDDESITSRKCFLCLENLPIEQLGLNYQSKFILLCNPFPIFSEHFTIASLKHVPQSIEEHFNTMLNVTKHLSTQFSVLYNGPRCGASAPDHMHFQAGTKSFLPLEDDFNRLKNEYGIFIIDSEKLILSAIDDGFRKIISIESNDEKLISDVFTKFLKAYKAVSNVSMEPMFNILSNYEEEYGWTIIIFLRSRNRPERYFREDEQKILVSPAVVDLSGMLITPREEDFNKINEETIRQIFQEVSLDNAIFNSLTELLKTTIK